MGYVMSGFHIIFKGDVALVFDELSERPTHKPLLSREKKNTILEKKYLRQRTFNNDINTC